jgi:hypothetical protein
MQLIMHLMGAGWGPDRATEPKWASSNAMQVHMVEVRASSPEPERASSTAMFHFCLKSQWRFQEESGAKSVVHMPAFST